MSRVIGAFSNLGGSEGRGLSLESELAITPMTVFSNETLHLKHSTTMPDTEPSIDTGEPGWGRGEHFTVKPQHLFTDLALDKILPCYCDQSSL